MSKKKKIILGIILASIITILIFSTNYYRKYNIYHNINMLKSSNAIVHKNAVENLVAIGEPAVDPLIFAISYDPVHAESKIMELISPLGKKKNTREQSSTLSEESVNLKSGAVIALGRIGDSRAAPAIAGLLKETHSSLEAAVFEAMLKLDDNAVPILIPLLRDKNPEVRCKASQLLGEIKNPVSVEPLAEVLYKDPDNEAKKYAAQALAAIGKPSVEYLIEGLEQQDYGIRCYSVDALGIIGDARAVKPLAAALYKNTYDVDIYKRIAEALGEIGSPDAFETLIVAGAKGDDDTNGFTLDIIKKRTRPGTALALLELMRGKNEFVRVRASELLAEINDPDVLEVLIKAFDDEDGFVRKSSIMAIERLADSQAVVPLLKRLKTRLDKGTICEPYWIVPGVSDEADKSSRTELNNDEARRVMNLKEMFPSVYLLQKIRDSKKYDIFIEILNDKKNELRPALIFFLEFLWNERGCFHIMDKAKSEDYRVRYILAKVSGHYAVYRGKIRKPRPTPPPTDVSPVSAQEMHLIYLLEDKDYRVRMEAAEALGNYQCIESLEYIRKLLKDENKSVRKKAEEAIRKIKEVEYY